MRKSNTNLEINDYLSRFVRAYTPEQGNPTIIRYDPALIDAAIAINCGPEPEPGTAYERWRVDADRVRNRMLDAYRTAANACGNIVYKPLKRNEAELSCDTN